MKKSLGTMIVLALLLSINLRVKNASNSNNNASANIEALQASAEVDASKAYWSCDSGSYNCCQYSSLNGNPGLDSYGILHYHDGSDSQ